MTYVMPVVVSIVASWLVGFIWFKVLFRLPSADGLSPFAVSALQHVGDVGFACLLAWIMVRTGTHTIPDALVVAVMIWLSFVLATGGHMYAFRSFSLRFFAITAGSVLVALLVIATILGALIK